MKILTPALIILVFLALVSNASAECFVATKNGNIRSGRGTDHEIIGNLKVGQVFTNLGYSTMRTDWIFIGEETAITPIDLTIQKNGIAVWKSEKPAVGKPAVILKEDNQGKRIYDTKNKGIVVKLYGETTEIEALHDDVGKIWTFYAQSVLYHPAKLQKIEKYVHRSLGERFLHDYQCENYSKNIFESISRKKKAVKRREKSVKANPLWPKEIQNSIMAGKIKLGMTSEQVIASWGRPNDINTSVGSWGKHEQWKYKDKYYLYFENDKLTSWQTW